MEVTSSRAARWWPTATGIGGALLTAPAFSSACHAGTANVPHAEGGTPRHEYCHGLPTGHPWVLFLVVAIGAVLRVTVPLRRRPTLAWWALVAVAVALVLWVSHVAGMPGNYTI